MSVSAKTKHVRVKHQKTVVSSRQLIADIQNKTPQQSVARQLAIPAMLTLLGLAALAIDVPLAKWFAAQKLPGVFKKTFDLAEVFGHGLGVAAILLMVWVLTPQLRSRLPRVICCAYLGGLFSDLLKLLLARSRPNTIDFTAVTSVWQTFHKWFPLLSGGSGQQSFTSAHTATAVGLALGLSWLLPRGKWLFGFFALLLAMQRMAGPYHFASDVLWGAAIGCLAACVCLPGGWLAPPFDRLEQKLATH